jgi:hypothetical protein
VGVLRLSNIPNIPSSMLSNIWSGRTERRNYTAPNGHVIYADPTYEASGQGHVRILNRYEHSFDFEITVFHGEFTVEFTSYERWMHRTATGEFKYRKSILLYIEDVR